MQIKQYIEALKIFDCVVLDHIILTEETYYSFADDGLMI
jgi:DNA repair protein RadC